jgi:ribose transport system permease protein
VKSLVQEISNKIQESRSAIVMIPAIVFLIIFTTTALVSRDFLNTENLINLPYQFLPLLCVAVGQLFVLLSGNIDLSIGALVSLTSCITSVTMDPALRIVLAVIAGIGVGLINGLNVAYLRINPIIMTLVTNIFVQGIALLIRPMPGGESPAALKYLDNGSFLGIPMSIVVIILVVLIGSIILTRTRFGLHIYAVGGASENAKLYGINTEWVVIRSFILCSMFAVLGGIVLAGRINSGNALVGNPLLIESIVAVALGGTILSGGIGSIAGTVIGSLILLIVKNGMNMAAVSVYLQSIVKSALLLLVVSLQRRKTFGI